MPEDVTNSSVETTEVSSQPESSSPEVDALPENGVRINENGEVEYGDKFFGDFDDPESDTSSLNGEQDTQISNEPAQPEISYYTPEELKNTPVYQWEKDRIPADTKVSDVYDTVSPMIQTLIQQNMLFRQAIANLQQQGSINGSQGMSNGQGGTNNPLGSNQSVVGRSGGSDTGNSLMTDEQIDDAAVNLACERLKISSNDFDPYDMKHQLALHRAYGEIQGQQSDIKQQQAAQVQFQQDGRVLGEFIGRMQMQPDYAAFNNWLSGQLKREGRDENALLNDLVENRNVRKTIGEVNRYYQMFKQTPRPAPKSSQSKSVPVVESAGNGSNEGVKKSFDYKSLGSMTPDQQAQALINLGLCELK